ncbi:hypothetical protein MRX96_022044 [Rhipicephalus microplus]
MYVQVTEEEISADETTEDAGWKNAGTRCSRARQHRVDSSSDIDASTNKLGIGHQDVTITPRASDARLSQQGCFEKLPDRLRYERFVNWSFAYSKRTLQEPQPVVTATSFRAIPKPFNKDLPFD